MTLTEIMMEFLDPYPIDMRSRGERESGVKMVRYPHNWVLTQVIIYEEDAQC